MAGAFTPGSQLGRFRLDAEIGRGGMGVVYRALDLGLNRPVAFKVLAPHMGDNDSVRARFHREAASVANLKHMHIATVYEFGEHESQPYIVFEWIEGQTLKDLLVAEGSLPLERALRLFDQCVGALDYAHQRGVIHRDIKPANIVVGVGDHATIVDFGLAWLATVPAITVSGSIFGTPRYMSPEQIQGERVDGRADLYSLAVVLYEMLTGQPPFDAPTPPALFQKHLFTSPPPITELNPSLPGAVEAALTRALAKEPADRFATGAAFSAALRDPDLVETLNLTPLISSRHNLTAPPVTSVTSEATLLSPIESSPVSRPVSPRKWAWWLVGLAALLLCLGGFVGLSWLSQETPQVAATSDPAEGTASAPADSTETPLEVLPTPLDTPLPETTPTSTLVPTITPTPTETPTPITPVPLAPPLEGGLWSMTTGDAAHSGFVYQGLGPLNPGPRWTRNPGANAVAAPVVGYNLVILALDGGVVRALDWATGLTVWEAPLEDTIIGPLALQVSENVALLYVPLAQNGLYALNLADGAYVWGKSAEELQSLIYGGVMIGGDGAVYVATDGGWLHAFNPATSETYWSVDLTQSDVFYLPPAVTGSQVFLSGATQAVYAVDLTTLAGTMWKADTLGSVTTPPNVAEGSGVLFVGADQGWVHAFGMADGVEWWRAQTSGNIVGLANDGARVYATSADGNVYAWEIGSGASVWVLNTGSGLGAVPLTDSGSVLVATQAGEVRYIEATAGQELTDLKLTLNDSIYYTPAPAGGWLFVRAGNVYGIGP